MKLYDDCLEVKVGFTRALLYLLVICRAATASIPQMTQKPITIKASNVVFNP